MFFQSKKNIVCQPILNFRTCGTTKLGVGGYYFKKLEAHFRRWGFKTSIDKPIHHDTDFTIYHLRPTKELEREVDTLITRKENGLSSYILVYLIEPLDLRISTWKSECALGAVIKLLELSDRIFVNSVGYFLSANYVETAKFKKFLEKTIVVRECLIEDVHQGKTIKIHRSENITAVWHGFKLNHKRWLRGDWPDIQLDPELYPNAYGVNGGENYGDLTTVNSSVPVVSITQFDKPEQGLIRHPGDRSIIDYLQRFDIGLAPFRTDTYRTVCKPFGAKIQAYMIAGLPVVASPIPDYKDVLEDQVTGIFAETRSDWNRALEQLKDPVLRNKIACNAREMALAEFSPDRMISKYERVLNEILQNRFL